MKIDRSGGKLKDFTQVTTKDSDKKVNETTSSKFMNFMDKAEDENFEDKMKNLAENIFEQGKKLAGRVDVRDLKLYKSMIMEFLNQVMNSSNRFNKQSKLDRRGRYKVFVTVKNINEELDELTKDVLSSQTDNLKVLKRIEDIRGMILDIEL